MDKKILVLFGLLQTYAALPSVTQPDEIEDHRRTSNANVLQKINVDVKFITSLINGIFGNSTEKTGNADVDGIVETVKYAMRSEDKDSQRPQNIKPVFVKFRSDQPSLMFEVNSNTILGAIKKFISSDTLERFSRAFAKKAANALRTIVEDRNEEVSKES